MRVEKCVEDNGKIVTVCVDDDTVRVKDSVAVQALIQVLNDATAKPKQGPNPDLPQVEIYCETCQFWEGDECLRYPPTIQGPISRNDNLSVCTGHFPVTDSDNWCGEWQERSKPAGAKPSSPKGESNEPT